MEFFSWKFIATRNDIALCAWYVGHYGFKCALVFYKGNIFSLKTVYKTFIIRWRKAIFTIENTPISMFVDDLDLETMVVNVDVEPSHLPKEFYNLKSCHTINRGTTYTSTHATAMLLSHSPTLWMGNDSIIWVLVINYIPTITSVS